MAAATLAFTSSLLAETSAPFLEYPALMYACIALRST